MNQKKPQRLADLKPETNGWYKWDECDYETLADVLQTGVLGFCACGRPEENLAFVRDVLEHIDSFFDASAPKQPFAPEWDEWYNKHKERELALLGNDRAAYFVFYWLDKEEYTEHGGSVPGWLTAEGKDLLAALRLVLSKPTDATE